MSTDPPIQDGDPVEVLTADGKWLPAIARSSPRCDQANAIHRLKPTFLSIKVDVVGGWTGVNWPAEGVRPTP